MITPQNSSGMSQIKNGSTASPGTLCLGSMINSNPSWYASVQNGANYPLYVTGINNGCMFFNGSYPNTLGTVLGVENVTSTSSNAIWFIRPKFDYGIDGYSWVPEKLNYWKGDVDMDGQITYFDFLKVMQYVSNPIANPLTDFQFYLADVNCDGVADFADLSIVQNMWYNNYDY